MPIDSQNMLQAIKDFPIQCRKALTLPRGIAVTHEINNIVVIGMGGSAIGGDLLKTILSSQSVPVEVVRDYKVPGYVGKDTLVFAVSYSGNTEEMIEAVEDAASKEATIIGLTSGGKLKGLIEHVIDVPEGMQPRAALGYLFFPLLGVLHNSNIIRVKNEELNEMIDMMKNNMDSFNEEAETIAKKIKGKIPIIYASEAFRPVAYRWKTQMNENSKQAAFFNVYSEMNHNEIAGFQGMDRSYAVVQIKDKDDHPQIKKRMEVCREIMENNVDVHEYQAQGNSYLARIFTTILMGDLVSYHLALWNRVDPTPVDVIEGMKQKL